MKPIIRIITDEWIKEKKPCQEALNLWDKKEKNSIKILKWLIKIEKYNWASWFIVRIMEYRDHVSYAVYAAEQVIDIYEKKYPDDERPREAIEAAKKCIDSPSEENKVAAAHAAAYTAADAAAYTAADAAAYAAHAAAYAAADAAYAAAHAAAYTAADAAYAAAHAAAYAAADAAAYAAHTAAYTAAYTAADAAHAAAYLTSNAAADAAADAAHAAADAAMKKKILEYGMELLKNEDV